MIRVLVVALSLAAVLFAPRACATAPASPQRIQGGSPDLETRWSEGLARQQRQRDVDACLRRNAPQRLVQGEPAMFVIEPCASLVLLSASVTRTGGAIEVLQRYCRQSAAASAPRAIVVPLGELPPGRLTVAFRAVDQCEPDVANVASDYELEVLPSDGRRHCWRGHSGDRTGAEPSLDDRLPKSQVQFVDFEAGCELLLADLLQDRFVAVSDALATRLSLRPCGAGLSAYLVRAQVDGRASAAPDVFQEADGSVTILSRATVAIRPDHAALALCLARAPTEVYQAQAPEAPRALADADTEDREWSRLMVRMMTLVPGCIVMLLTGLVSGSRFRSIPRLLLMGIGWLTLASWGIAWTYPTGFVPLPTIVLVALKSFASTLVASNINATDVGLEYASYALAALVMRQVVARHDQRERVGRA